MPVYTAKEFADKLTRGHDTDDTLIIISWNKCDFPRVWDRITEEYGRNNWDDALVAATAEAMDARTRLNLPKENSNRCGYFLDRDAPDQRNYYLQGADDRYVDHLVRRDKHWRGADCLHTDPALRYIWTDDVRKAACFDRAWAEKYELPLLPGLRLQAA